MLTRRRILLSAAAAAAGFGGYGFGIEPMSRPRVVSYALTPPGWPPGEKLKIACLADLHAGEPFCGLERVERIVALINAEKPDLIVLLGDYQATHHFLTADVPPDALALALGKLSAPLGRHAILGNHDYWGELRKFTPGSDADARANASVWQRAFDAAGVPVLRNKAQRIATPGGGFFLAGVESFLAVPLGRRRFRGFDDLPGTLAQAPQGAPLILLAHEPDSFAAAPPGISVTLSGHTHGGQVRLPLIGSPWVPSRYGERYRYGHVVEENRHLIISAGIGMSGLPLRFRMPPEVNIVTLGG